MAVSPSGETTIIVVNCKDEADDFEISFEKNINSNLNRYVFDPTTLIPDENAEIIKSDKSIAISSVLKDTISPFGVTVYTNIKE